MQVRSDDKIKVLRGPQLSQTASMLQYLEMYTNERKKRLSCEVLTDTHFMIFRRWFWRNVYLSEIPDIKPELMVAPYAKERMFTSDT